MRELLHQLAHQRSVVLAPESDLRAYLDEIADHNMPVTEMDHGRRTYERRNH